jgi:glycosyltransferase involved in cell wall biosynthesis
MRFHLLGLPNAPINKKNNSNPFAIKCFHMADMMTKNGYEVFLYGVDGVDGSEVNAHLITCLSKDDFNYFYPYDQEKYGYDHDNIDAWREFNSNCARAVKNHKTNDDIILCPMGACHDIVRDYNEISCVEFSIGHICSTHKNHRIFESHTWANFIYGKENNQLPSKLDSVIPPFFDGGDYAFQEHKDDYMMFIGRLIPEKGIDLVVKLAEYSKSPILIAGSGDYKPQSKYVEYIGSINIEQRKEYLKFAKALIVPSQYTEPLGSVAVEAMLSGTPIITSNRGALPEINLHGKTGFVCWKCQDYYHAYDRLSEISTNFVYQHSQKYLKENIAPLYVDYFKELELSLYKE